MLEIVFNESVLGSHAEIKQKQAPSSWTGPWFVSG